MNEYCIGGIPSHIERNYHLVRFVQKEVLDSCRQGNFLIGSIHRNRAFDDARGDQGEATVTVTLKSKEPTHTGFHFEGEECKKYTLIAATEKFTGMRAHGWSIANQPLITKNLPSLSFALISKNCSHDEKIIQARVIRESIGMNQDSPCLVIKKPNELIKTLSHVLTSQKLTSAKRLTVLTGKINYAQREITTFSKATYMKTIDELFYSGALNVGFLFTKPENYKEDREFRVVWIGHSGPTHQQVRTPLNTDINSKNYLILPGINFAQNFSLIEDLEQTH